MMTATPVAEVPEDVAETRIESNAASGAASGIVIADRGEHDWKRQWT